LQKTIEKLKLELKNGQPEKVIVENYVVGPSLVVIDLQNKLEQMKKREKSLINKAEATQH